MSNIFLEKYKNYEELMNFCVAQNTSMIAQAKKIVELQEELAHVKSLLVDSVPIFEPDSSKLDKDSKDEEVIARIEIQKLRYEAMNRPLTFEESRKLEIYTKILSNIASRKKPPIIDVSNLSNDDLLEQLTDKK